VYWMSMYSVKPHRRDEFKEAMKKQKEFIAKRRKEFTEIMAWRLHTQVYGGSFLSFIDIWEYDSLAECDRFNQEWMAGGRLVESSGIWKRKMTSKWFVRGY